MNIKNLKRVKPHHLLIVLAVGVFLLVSSNFFVPSKKQESDNNKSEAIVVNDIEKRLAEIVKKIDGINDADVFITYENSGVKRHATNIKDDAVTGEKM